MQDNIQLEVGNIANEFTKVPVELDLIRCQRYYEILPIGLQGGRLVPTVNNSLLSWMYKVTKVSIPTVVKPAVDNESVSVYGSTKSYVNFMVTNTGNATTTIGIADARLYS